jgi:Orsellinic acid/F9775 biosynthesis cluster protein D
MDPTSMSLQYVLYLDEFKVVICRQCEYGITKGGIRLHFERHHTSIPVKDRRALENHLLSLQIAEVKDVKAPVTAVEFIKGLKIHEGYMCAAEGCHHLRTTLVSIKKHCQSEHRWTASKGTYYNDKC